MPLKTRGSSALDKAQRRLALLKSIDETLDLGHGLTVESYARAIDSTRATLEAHNTLLANLDESRKTVAQLDKDLSALSERMLSGIATLYGRSSIEYAKAGGSNRKRSKSSAPVAPAIATPATSTQTATTAATTNDNGKLSAVS
jgi:hypothetical protein